MALRWKAELDTSSFVASAQAATGAAKAYREELGALGGALKDTGAAGGAVAKGAAAPRGGGGAAPKAAKREAPNATIAQLKGLTGASAIKVEELAGGFQRLTVGAHGAEKSVIGVFDTSAKRFSATRSLVGKIEREQEAEQKKMAAAKDKRTAKSGSGLIDWAKRGAAASVGAGAAALGFSGAMDLTKIALGFRGMWQLQSLAVRAQWNFRSLFRGVDPSPVLRAADRLFQAFNPRSFIGNQLSKTFERTFNGIFSLIERAEPYVTAFGKGFLIGFNYLQIAVLKAQIALVPLEPLFDSVFGKANMMKVSVAAGAIAFGAMAAYALAAVAPVLAVAGAVASVTAAADQLDKYNKMTQDKEGKGHGLALWWAKAKNRVGATSDEQFRTERAKIIGLDKMSQQEIAAWSGQFDPAWSSAQPAAAKAGDKIGGALADGALKGLADQTDKLMAGGAAMVANIDKGASTKAEIRSPSKLFERRARQMGEGAERGLVAAGPGVQSAAERGLVPDAGGGRGGAGGPREVHLHLQIMGPVYGSRSALERLIREVFDDRSEEILIALGGAPG